MIACLLINRKFCLLLSNAAAAAPGVEITRKLFEVRVVRGLLLLLFVIVCRMTQFVAVVQQVLHLMPVFLSLYSNTISFYCTPWQCCRMYSLDLPIQLLTNIDLLRGPERPPFSSLSTQNSRHSPLWPAERARMPETALLSAFILFFQDSSLKVLFLGKLIYLIPLI